MKIACIRASARGKTDLLLQQLAAHLAGQGVRTAGTVQINTERADSHRCDMDVQILPDGPIFRISQNLGRASRGCRLDPAALEQAVAASAIELADSAQILIVNKFGKHEAEGRGFRGLIADALERDLPVIVGLNAMNEPAFDAFADGFARRLPPDLDALKAWAASALSLNLKNAVQAAKMKSLEPKSVAATPRIDTVSSAPKRRTVQAPIS